MVHVLVLALDTSSPSGSLAVLRDEKVVGVVSTATGEVYSSRMFRELEFLLGELSLRGGKPDEARVHFAESLAIRRKLREIWSQLLSIEAVARMLVRISKIWTCKACCKMYLMRRYSNI